MRKITLLTTLFSVLLGTVSASAQPVEGKFYRIKDNTRTKYLTITDYDKNSTGTHGTVPVLAEETGNPDQVWELVAVDAANNQYKLRSKSEYYLQCRGWCCDAVSTDGSTITIEEVSTDEYHFKNGSSFFKVEAVSADGGKEHPFCDAPAGNGNIVTWSFVEVPTDEDFTPRVSVTYRYMVDGKEYSTTTMKQPINSDVNAPSQLFLTIQNTSGSIGTEDCEIVVNCTANLPFVTATDASSISQWYYVKMHGNSVSTSFISQADDNTIAWVKKVGEINIDAAETDKYLWGFVGDIFGIKMVNRAELQAIKSTGSGKATLTAFADATAFKFTANQYGSTDWFCLKNTTSNNYLNAQGDAVNHYSDNDNGSSMQLVVYNEVPVNLSNGWATFYNNVKTMIPAGVEAYIVSGKDDTKATLQRVEGALPANTGVLLKGSGDVKMGISINNTVADVAGNLLLGSATDTNVAEDAYVLANGPSGVGFYLAKKNQDGDTAFKNNAHKAYLPKGASNAPALTFDFGTETAIENVTVEKGNGASYDLSGRRVKNATKGIFIINGKKVIK